MKTEGFKGMLINECVMALTVQCVLFISKYSFHPKAK